MRIILLLLAVAVPAWGGELRVGVAANFKPTLLRINAGFEESTGHRVIVSSASTGMLYNQLRQGAPFHLFLAADRQAPEQLQAGGHGPADGRFCYAVGRLVLAGAARLDDLANPDLSLAIANPATAPYGSAAEEVLSRPEFAGGAGRRRVQGANAAQAHQFWYSGGTELALLPRSLVADGIAIPATWHRPIEQHALVLRAGEDYPPVDAYLEWLKSDTVRTLITHAGYDPCP